MRRSWTNLGVVETIYEEEHEDFSSSNSSPDPKSLRSRVRAWSVVKGRKTDVAIHVQDSCFHLHKDPLATKSNYLKRLLTESSQITLSPPLNITPQTFHLVADHCYGAHVVITPSNVAPLRIAAELLEMTESNGGRDESLRHKTETYFRRAIAVNREYASIVLRSCLAQMPEAETTAALVSKCIEALTLVDDDDDNNVVNYLHDIITVRCEDFRLIAESMHRTLTRIGGQDLLYRIVDLYFKEYTGNITDEQKMQICNYIDCSILSPQLLMHAVQNPRMPLRFVVQAMFIEQLNTRRSVLSAANHHAMIKTTTHQKTDHTATLGALLQRDAALRQVVQLKSAMDATSSRIQSLEKELSGMRRAVLDKTENLRNEQTLDNGRSASFRLISERKVERGQRGSISWSSFRGGISSSEESCDGSITPMADRKNFGRRLMNGLKRISSLGRSKKVDGSEYESGGDVIVIKKDVPFLLE